MLVGVEVVVLVPDPDVLPLLVVVEVPPDVELLVEECLWRRFFLGGFAADALVVAESLALPAGVVVVEPSPTKEAVLLVPHAASRGSAQPAHKRARRVAVPGTNPGWSPTAGDSSASFKACIPPLERHRSRFDGSDQASEQGPPRSGSHRGVSPPLAQLHVRMLSWVFGRPAVARYGREAESR